MKACPDLGKKPKIHLFLHLPQNMLDFGSPSAYNREVCMQFNHNTALDNTNLCPIIGVNHLIHWYGHKTYSNRQSPSRDVATGFATPDYLRYIVSGGQFGQLKQRLVNNLCI